MSAEELRELVREILPWLDDRALANVVNRLIDRAARGDSGWTPPAPSGRNVSKIVSFAEEASRNGSADPSVVDRYLRQGSSAFLGKDYATAFTIFHALLLPVGECKIDLGHHEMVDEVLGVEAGDCAAQYVVSMYMTAAPTRRAEAVHRALRAVRGIRRFWNPLRVMEQVAVEPLPQFQDFLRRWPEAIEANTDREHPGTGDRDEDRWIREAVQRMEGAEGLGKLARSTKRTDDLRAWCSVLVAARDWKAALPAYEEAAEIVADEVFWRAEFLDGAALAAQELGRKDLPVRLGRAWREVPTLLRLRRWLGVAKTRAAVRSRATEALAACPKNAHRQQAFLHVLLGDFDAAAKLLAAAPGPGWSAREHPGHLLFPIFSTLLAENPAPGADSGPRAKRRMSFKDPEWRTSEYDGPRLATPKIEKILDAAGAGKAVSKTDREAVSHAMREAAENRLAEVTGEKRRRAYRHAAELVGACAAIDPDPEATAGWIAKIRTEYRRFTALQRELGKAL